MDLELALQHRAQVQEFRQKHHTGMVSLVSTDPVASTPLKAVLDRECADSAELRQSRHQTAVHPHRP
jgi:hypothetical protein